MAPAGGRVTSRTKGLVLIVLSNLCFSTGGVIVRSVAEPPDGFEVVMWRSVAMAAAIAALLLASHGADVARQMRAVGLAGVLSASFLALTFFAYILSVMHTTVANTTVTMSLAPFFTAIAGLLFLGEQVPRRAWLAMALAAIGLATMVLDSLSGDGMFGILLALGVPLGVAGNVVVNRRLGQHVDLLPTVFVAGVISIAIALPLALPLSASPRDIGVILLMGVVQLAGGCTFLTLAMRHLSAAEVGLYMLLETGFGPLWVWLAHGERPANLALIGGAIIVAALVLNALLALHEQSRRQPRRA